MTRHELGRLVLALAISAAAGWVGACIVMAERLTRPEPWPPPLHLLDKESGAPAPMPEGVVTGAGASLP